MTDHEKVARGQRAFAEYEELGPAFDKVEAAILKALSETPVGQETKVLNLHKAVQNLAAVKHAMRAVIDEGRVAADAIAIAGLTRVAA